MKTEVLAPAGSPETMQAALDAKADAVYFGLRKLNARRGAANFPAMQLADIMSNLHSNGVKGYLTVNIDLTQRDLGLAARILALAEQAKVDAVLVRDPAILEMRNCFPSLPFHFSTQAAVSSSAGVEAAKEFGISRVVLAREMSRDEIAACVLPDMELEVFVQGALCFSCSGRCLMSSWVGGRSGNRGACASPCRVAWKNGNNGEAGRPLSMHDLCLIDKVNDLKALGIASLKIEGRLKNADWVRRAVTLYRNAVDEVENGEKLRQQADSLGAYTGRLLTSGYYDEVRADMTGEAARPSALSGSDVQTIGCQTSEAPDHPRLVFSREEDGAVICRFAFEDFKDKLRIPPQKIANPRRAVHLGDMAQELLENSPKALKTTCTFLDNKIAERVLLPRRFSSALQSFFDASLRQAQKEDEDKIKVSLPESVQQLLIPRKPSGANTLTPDAVPDRIRISKTELPWLMSNWQLLESYTAICQIEPGELETWKELIEKSPATKLILALPQVIYEKQLEDCKSIIAFASKHSNTLEVNSWDTWHLARTAGVALEAGPGLAVFNANAARLLHAKGCKIVAISSELDKKQLEELCAVADTPLSLTVMSRLPLMQTRAELPNGYRPEDTNSFSDTRELQVLPRHEGALTVLRPVLPYDLRKVNNPAIKAAHLVIDLTASPSPDLELKYPVKHAGTFNYDRRLR